MKKILNLIKSANFMAVLAVVGFVVGMLGIYGTFFYEKKPVISVSVDALSRVFDIHQPVGGLEVSYAGENLRSAKKALWVSTISIRNVGNSEVRRGDYDDRAPFGLDFGDAVIVDAPKINSDNSYLTENLHPRVDGGRVAFSEVIFEAGEAYEITTLLLGPEDTTPNVRVLGKIAGLQGFLLTKREIEFPVWDQAFKADSIWVHVLRAFAYPVATMVALVFLILMLAALLAVFIIPLSSRKERREKEKRQEKLAGYRKSEGVSKQSRFLMDSYVNHGESGLRAIYYYLAARQWVWELSKSLDGLLDPAEKKSAISNRVDSYGLYERGQASVVAGGFFTLDKDLNEREFAQLREDLLGFCHFLELDPVSLNWKGSGSDALEHKAPANVDD